MIHQDQTTHVRIAGIVTWDSMLRLRGVQPIAATHGPQPQNADYSSKIIVDLGPLKIYKPPRTKKRNRVQEAWHILVTGVADNRIIERLDVGVGPKKEDG